MTGTQLTEMSRTTCAQRQQCQDEWGQNRTKGHTSQGKTQEDLDDGLLLPHANGCDTNNEKKKPLAKISQPDLVLFGVSSRVL